jgi:hypothetical protein
MPTKKKLATALKARIRHDNPDFFTPEDWEGDAWLDVPLGRFYDEDEELVDNVVFEVTRDVLKDEGRKLPGSAVEQLADAVNTDTTPPDAVNEMFLAAQLAVPAESDETKKKKKKKKSKKSDS